MKLTNFTIPYPILGIDGAFEERETIHHSFEMTMTQHNYEFHIVFELKNETILKLIADKQAKYACEVDCTKTFFREVYTSSDKSFTIEIPRVNLVGKNISFFLSIVLTEEVSQYENSQFNQRFYKGYKFDLNAGDMLAYFGQEMFNADIKYDELRSVGSIVEVKEDKKENFTHFDFSSDKIRIFLPTEEFKDFKLTNNHNLADITHASIVQCALTSALFSFKENKNTNWAATLKMRVKNDKQLKEFENLEYLTSLQISKMVSIILDNSNKRMFERLKMLQREN